MITDKELSIIVDMHGYRHSTAPHWPGCFEFHPECAILWLVATVRELAPYAAKRLETKGVAEETREKELIKCMEYFLELMRITDSASCHAYLEAYKILRAAKGLPPEDVIRQPHHKPKAKKPPKKLIPRPEIEGPDETLLKE